MIDPDQWFKLYWRNRAQGKARFPTTRWDMFVLEAEGMWKRGELTPAAFDIHMACGYNELCPQAQIEVVYPERTRFKWIEDRKQFCRIVPGTRDTVYEE